MGFRHFTQFYTPFWVLDTLLSFTHLLGFRYRFVGFSRANIYIMQSGRFYSQMRKIFKITYNSMDKIFPESGRLWNWCTRISLFSLKIRKSSAESGRVGSSGFRHLFHRHPFRLYRHLSLADIFLTPMAANILKTYDTEESKTWTKDRLHKVILQKCFLPCETNVTIHTWQSMLELSIISHRFPTPPKKLIEFKAITQE